MRWKDQFRFIRQNLKKNRVRTWMTIFATAIGCAFLIVLASVGYGLQKSIVKDAMEEQIVTQINVHGIERDEQFKPVTMKDIRYLESVDGVRAVTRRNDLYQIPRFSVDGYRTEASAIATHFPSEKQSGLTLSEGRLPEKDNEVVVGYNFSSYLASEKELDQKDIYDEQGKIKAEYRYDSPLLGKTLAMTVDKEAEEKVETHTISLKVVGILEKPTREWFEDQNVYITQAVLKDIEKFTGTYRGDPSADAVKDGLNEDEQTFDQVKVYATDLESVTAVSNQLEEKDYAIYSVVSEMKQINMFFTIAKAGLILVGTIAVLIASIGIYNTMTMAVTERAPDIGIMKAIGANPKTIKQIFLLESGYIGLMGAALGTGIAYVTSILINTGVPLILSMAFEEELPEGLQFSSIPPGLVAISVAICLIVTILSGLRPAKRATEIDVLQAMRREI
ncbi:FtsX-like permease family protein [Virgibacillus sp. LDC-1]|uniref:ABC transporter permease n=1 Tax=Virgibacillus sp. LDC-1 TaxID=3039856 RepID=UPI0024DE38B0|nr:FtsX-like permease family protein [Virgibacillus sp. LDC-1]